MRKHGSVAVMSEPICHATAPTPSLTLTFRPTLCNERHIMEFMLGPKITLSVDNS